MQENNRKLLKLQYQLELLEQKINELKPIIKELAMDENLDRCLDPENYKKRQRRLANQRYYQKTKQKNS